MSVQINKKKGFTLIELLIAIAILAILSSFGMAALTSAQKKARDATRKNDLNQVKKAMIMARNDCLGNYYPRGTADITSNTTEKSAFTNELMAALTNTTSGNPVYYLKTAFKDPLNNATYYYGFKATPNSSNPPAVANVCLINLTTYRDGTPAFVLRTKLEQGKNEPETNASRTNCQTIINTLDWGTDPAPASDDDFYYVCAN